MFLKVLSQLILKIKSFMKYFKKGILIETFLCVRTNNIIYEIDVWSVDGSLRFIKNF